MLLDFIDIFLYYQKRSMMLTFSLHITLSKTKNFLFPEKFEGKYLPSLPSKYNER